MSGKVLSDYRTTLVISPESYRELVLLKKLKDIKGPNSFVKRGLTKREMKERLGKGNGVTLLGDVLGDILNRIPDDNKPTEKIWLKDELQKKLQDDVKVSDRQLGFPISGLEEKLSVRESRRTEQVNAEFIHKVYEVPDPIRDSEYLWMTDFLLTPFQTIQDKSTWGSFGTREEWGEFIKNLVPSHSHHPRNYLIGYDNIYLDRRELEYYNRKYRFYWVPFRIVEEKLYNPIHIPEGFRRKYAGYADREVHEYRKRMGLKT